MSIFFLLKLWPLKREGGEENAVVFEVKVLKILKDFYPTQIFLLCPFFSILTFALSRNKVMHARPV